MPGKKRTLLCNIETRGAEGGRERGREGKGGKGREGRGREGGMRLAWLFRLSTCYILYEGWR